jgi:hypothetical protein
MIWVVLGVCVLAGAVVIEQLNKHGKKRPLSVLQPKSRTAGPVPLGMEATDTECFRVALERDAVNDVTQTNRYDRMKIIVAEPIADDETYAARYQRAFGNDEKENK